MSKKGIFKYKHYPHFDTKKGPGSVIPYINDPEWITHHGFLPFIHYVKKVYKFSVKDGRKPVKTRDIYYSGHADRYIFQLYASKLNNLYNGFAADSGINNCSIAYRNNKSLSNISFAKEVFDFIQNHNECVIFVGDFTNFFDNLNHAYIKESLSILLKMYPANIIPPDYYTIYKNITRFSYIDKDAILKEFNLKEKDIRDKRQIISPEQFRQIKKYIKTNNNDFGIPQGSAISAVLSNIYMMRVDKAINDLVTSNNGMYRRYCDDFIIIVPGNMEEKCRYIKQIIDVFRQTPNLQLHDDKTALYQYKDRSLLLGALEDNGNIDNTKRMRLDYLGFSFDGINITVREKTIAKYYSRLYKKIKHVNKHYLGKGKKIPRKKLYKLYGVAGSKVTKDNRHGNFLTYIRRAQKEFQGQKMDICIRRSNKKIKKALVNQYSKDIFLY